MLEPNPMAAEQPTACDLAIFDNDQHFSFCRSPFRRTEYAYYLQAYATARVYSTFAERLASEGKALAEWQAEYQELEPQVFPLAQAARNPWPRLAYTVFLTNAGYFLPFWERHNLPFAFTLYPGGGFCLNDAASDLRLRRVFTSPCFRKVIATQELTSQYVLARDMCRPEQVELIRGCVLPLDELTRELPPRRRFPEDKSTLDVAFVAFKYSPRGEDKGFDIFVSCAARLSQVLPQARFHVVGTFTADDLPSHAPRSRFTFYGPRPTDFFPQFYSGIDLMLAPTRPFVLAPGAFDGFPTAACTEAAACGVAVFCTDVLGMNAFFVHDQDMVIIPPDADAASVAVLQYCRQPEKLRQLGANGRQVVLARYNRDAQLLPRLKSLRACMEAEPADGATASIMTGLDAAYLHLCHLEYFLREASRPRDPRPEMPPSCEHIRPWKRLLGPILPALRSIRSRHRRARAGHYSWRSLLSPLKPILRPLWRLWTRFSMRFRQP
jgi:glycosyltransferase involved in cell wall biosynthesis